MTTSGQRRFLLSLQRHDRIHPRGTVTVVGCVVREADYRKTQDAGRGGVAGTGVGAGNEFVLTGASGAPTGGPTAGRPPSGVDVTSKDLQLREIEVQSIKETGTTCPA